MARRAGGSRHGDRLPAEETVKARGFVVGDVLVSSQWRHARKLRSVAFGDVTLVTINADGVIIAGDVFLRTLPADVRKRDD